MNHIYLRTVYAMSNIDSDGPSNSYFQKQSGMTLVMGLATRRYEYLDTVIAVHSLYTQETYYISSMNLAGPAPEEFNVVGSQDWQINPEAAVEDNILDFSMVFDTGFLPFLNFFKLWSHTQRCSGHTMNSVLRHHS